MYEFTFNWLRWPFVVIDESMDRNLRERIDPELEAKLEAWCDFMLANFDENDGFSSVEAEELANAQYDNLAGQLRAKGLAVTTDNWWS